MRYAGYINLFTLLINVVSQKLIFDIIFSGSIKNILLRENYNFRLILHHYIT